MRLPGEKNEIKTFQAGDHRALFKSPHPPSGVGPPHEGTRSHGTGVSAGPGLNPWPVCGCPPGRGVGDVPSRRGFIPKASSPRAGRPGSPSKVPPGRRGRLECVTLARGASSRIWSDFLHPLEVSGGSRHSLPCSQGLLPAPPGKECPQQASERATCCISEFITSPSVSTPNRANGVPTALKVTRPGAGQPQLSFPVLRSVLPPALCGLWDPPAPALCCQEGTGWLCMPVLVPRLPSPVTGPNSPGKSSR